MISPCVKNHPEEKLAVPFRAEGTTHTTTQSNQNPQESQTKLKYHLPNQSPSLLCKSPLSTSIQADWRDSCRLVLQPLISIKRMFYIWVASASQLVALPFYSSLHPCYRGGMLLTTFCSPFPIPKPFQDQIVPSKWTLPARKCNLTAPTQRSQCTFSLCPPSALTSKLRESHWHLAQPFCTERREQGWSHSLNHGFQLWPTGSCRLLAISGKLQGLRTGSPNFNNAFRFIQPPVSFTAVSQDSVCS